MPGTVVVWLALVASAHAQLSRPAYRPQQAQPARLRYQPVPSPAQILGPQHADAAPRPRLPQPQLLRQATGPVKLDPLPAGSQPLRQVALPPKYDGVLSPEQAATRYSSFPASPQSLAGPLKYSPQYSPTQLLQQTVVSPKYELAPDDQYPGGFQRYQYAPRPVDVGYAPSFPRKTQYYKHYSPSTEYYQKPHYSYAPDQEMLEVQKEVLELVEPLHKEDGMFPQKNRSSMYALLVPLMLLGISIPAIGFMYTYLNRRRSFARFYSDADACSFLPSNETLDCYMKILQRSLECFHKKCE